MYVRKGVHVPLCVCMRTRVHMPVPKHEEAKIQTQVSSGTAQPFLGGGG